MCKNNRRLVKNAAEASVIFVRTILRSDEVKSLKLLKQDVLRKYILSQELRQLETFVYTIQNR